MRFRLIALLVTAFALVTGAAGAAQAVTPHSSAAVVNIKPGQTVTAGGVTITSYTSEAQAQAAMRAGVCPVGDGSATWGDGKVCTDDVYGARVHFRDSLTDGHCVKVMYWSTDASVWRQEGPTACTTGQWLTFGTSAGKMVNPNARLYKADNSAYFTMPSTL